MMPKAEIKSNFIVITTIKRDHTSTYDLLDDFLEAYVEGDFHSETELKDSFEDFVRCNYDLIPDLPFEEDFEELDTIEILNWDEIYPALIHLIDEDRRKQCCKTYSNLIGYIYCPICGTKLK